MYLYLLKYNNFVNRIVKKEDELMGYLTDYPYKVVKKNFEMRDGVDTRIDIKWDADFTPDYLLVISEDDNTKITSRWFITDMINTSGKNYICPLHRDVMVDNYDSVVSSPCFIQKGFVSNDNPLIFNKENFSCNQIKKGETLLTDKTLCSWIVLYYDLTKRNTLSGNINFIDEPFIDLTSYATKNDWEIYSRYHNGYHYPYQRRLAVYVDQAGTTDEAKVSFTDDMSVWVRRSNVQNNDTELEYYDSGERCLNAIVSCINSNKANIKSELADYKDPLDSLESFRAWNNKVVKFGDGKYYRVKIALEGTTWEYDVLSSGDLFDQASNAFKSGGQFKAGWSGSFTDAFQVEVNMYNYSLTLDEVTNITQYDYDFTKGAILQDAPYGIIAMPYMSWLGTGVSVEGYPVVDNLSLQIARELCKAGVGPGKTIYDAQILPYCPNTDLKGYYPLGTTVNLLPSIDIMDYGDLPNDNVPYSFVYRHGSSWICGLAIFPTVSKFTFDIYESIDTENPKVENQCDFYRLVSPNYNGQFEFNAARNRGVAYFNVDCTYKPYQPYIHINPSFNGLYGEDYNDARGLICGGDFSMTVVTSAWENYKLQNKNYQDIFNRQIENMDVMHDIQKQEAIWGAVAGGVQGTASGAVTGAMVGGPIGAAVGGVVGAGASIAGGIADYQNMEKRYAESRDLAVDMHNYQLQNIQALPNSLSKVDAYNNNNKIFPILEYYTCTDEEKMIFENKLKYEGMTVNAVGYIQNYLNTHDLTYIKGQLYRLDNFDEDYHVANVICDELSKGVYF